MKKSKVCIYSHITRPYSAAIRSDESFEKKGGKREIEKKREETMERIFEEGAFLLVYRKIRDDSVMKRERAGQPT